MKKKIINGILMAAMLFAGTTSFVSCKDNVDDVAADLYVNINGVKTRVSALESEVAALNSSVLKNTQDIAKLNSDLTALQGKVGELETAVATNAANIEALSTKIDEAIAEMNNKIAEFQAYLNNLTVGVIVQGTKDPVFGTLNSVITGKYNTLCGFIGENTTGIDIFPVDGADFNVRGTTGALKSAEIDWDLVQEFEAEKGTYLNSTLGNQFGKVYVTVNPIGAYAPDMEFALVKTNGVPSPVQLTNIQASSTVITKALGKHPDVTDAFAPVDGAPYMWEFDATAPMDSLTEAMIGFDYLHFNSAKIPEWDFQTLGKEIKHVWNTLRDNTKTNHEKAAEAIQEAWAIMNQVGEAINNKRAEMPQYGIACTYNGRTLYSEANITSVAIKPIGYTLAVEFDDYYNAGKIQWDLSKVSSVVNKIVTAVEKKLPDFAGKYYPVSITTTGGNFVVYPTNAFAAALNAGGATAWYVDPVTAVARPWEGNDSGTSTTPIATVPANDVLSQLNISTITNMVNDALKYYDRVKNWDPSNFMQRVERKLNNGTRGVIEVLGGNIAMQSVTPTVFFDSTLGIQELMEGVTNNFKGAGEIDLYLSSATKEYLVPNYLKYIAVCKDGKVIPGNAALMTGDQVYVSLELPEGKSEIVYQVLDYTGRTITKRFPINVK
jgi:uncharacterized coiled-coil protein SlyX